MSPTATGRGRHKVLVGIDYRVGDGWQRAEPGDAVDDLDDISEATYRGWLAQGVIQKAKPAARAKREG